MFIVNPDAAFVAGRLDGAHANYARMSDPEAYFNPDCQHRAIFGLGEGTLGVFTPSLMRLNGLQGELDVLLMCAAFAKKHWMGRWCLNGTDNREHLFRAAVAAEIVGIETIGYEISIDRRKEANWVKHQAGKRMRSLGPSTPASLAEKRCQRIASQLHYSFNCPDYSNFVRDVPILYIKDLAGPMPRLQRLFRRRPAGYRHLVFSMDLDA
jgi:hypothetical protein